MVRTTVAITLGLLLSCNSSAQTPLDIAELDAGGNWLVFRHATKGDREHRGCKKAPPPKTALCGGQGVLTKKGIEEAIHIRHALSNDDHKIHSTVQVVYSSSCSRTLETARLIAGDVVSVKPQDNLRIGDPQASASLLELIEKTKVPHGKNIFVVTHSTVITKAFDIDLGYADAVLIKAGTTNPKGRIYAEQWSKDASVKASIDTYCR